MKDGTKKREKWLKYELCKVLDIFISLMLFWSKKIPPGNVRGLRYQYSVVFVAAPIFFDNLAILLHTMQYVGLIVINKSFLCHGRKPTGLPVGGSPLHVY